MDLCAHKYTSTAVRCLCCVQTRSIHVHTHTPLQPNKHWFVKCAAIAQFGGRAVVVLLLLLLLLVCDMCKIYTHTQPKRVFGFWFAILSKSIQLIHQTKYYRKIIDFFFFCCVVIVVGGEHVCIYVWFVECINVFQPKAKLLHKNTVQCISHYFRYSVCSVCTLYIMQNLEMAKMLDCVFMCISVWENACVCTSKTFSRPTQNVIVYSVSTMIVFTLYENENCVNKNLQKKIA